MKVLVGYATRYGSTREVAEKVGEVMKSKGAEVVVANIADKPDVSGYDAAGIRCGRCESLNGGTMNEKTYNERIGALSKRTPTGMVVGKITALKAYLILLVVVLFSCISSPFQKVGIVRVSKLFAEVYYANQLFSEKEMKEWCFQRAERILEKSDYLAVTIIVLYDRRAARYFSRPRNFHILLQIGDVEPYVFTDTVYVKRKTIGGGLLVMNQDYETSWSFVQRKEISNP